MAYRLDDDNDIMDEDGVVKDGKSVRVPLFLMDSLQQEVSLAERRRIADDAREEYIASLNGWRNPKPSLSDDEVFALAQRIAPMLGLAAPKKAAASAPPRMGDVDTFTHGGPKNQTDAEALRDAAYGSYLRDLNAGNLHAARWRA